MRKLLNAVAIVAAIVFIGGLVVGGASLLPLSTANAGAALSAQPETTPAPTPSPTASETTCEATGPAEFMPNESHRVILDGLAGDSPEAAHASAMEAAATNPVFVAGIAMERKMHGGAHIDAASLVEDGCWTREGYELSLMVQGSIESAAPSLGEAPQTGINSGSNSDGQLVIAEQVGIWGDTRALILTHANGTKTVILLRCGNIVFQNPPPGVPPGPTDNPPKNIEDAPQNQGNLPEQQMPNPLPADPNHYQPDAPSSPPSVYVPPSPPPANDPPPVVVEPDPEPITEDPDPGPGW